MTCAGGAGCNVEVCGRVEQQAHQYSTAANSMATAYAVLWFTTEDGLNAVRTGGKHYHHQNCQHQRAC